MQEQTRGMNATIVVIRHMMKRGLFCCCVVLALALQYFALLQLEVQSTSREGAAAAAAAAAQLKQGPDRSSASVGEPTLPLTSQSHIRCQTTRGDFDVELRSDLAPHGVQHLRNMVSAGFFDQGIAFFRVNTWITQFGAEQSPQHRQGKQDPFKAVRSGYKKDVHPDLVLNSSTPLKSLTPWIRGTLALIGGTHMVVVIKPNPQMGTQPHDAPAAFIVKGMETVFDHLYKYNDVINNPKGDPGPRQEMIYKEGLDYINREFPKTDIIKKCFFL